MTDQGCTIMTKMTVRIKVQRRNRDVETWLFSSGEQNQSPLLVLCQKGFSYSELNVPTSARNQDSVWMTEAETVIENDSLSRPTGKYSQCPSVVSWGQCELSVTWSITEINGSRCVHSEPLPSSFSSLRLSCTDNTELASLCRVSFTLSPIPSVSNLFNHFSALGSFYFPFVSFCHFGFLLYNNIINPLVLWFFPLLLCSLTCYTCFYNFKKMC